MLSNSGPVRVIFPALIVMSALVVFAAYQGAVSPRAASAQSNDNPAMNTPDRVAWQLFLAVNANAATTGNNDALFETWASDGETFRPNPPPFPAGHRGLRLAPRALQLVHEQAEAQSVTSLLLFIPPAGAGEETRRNKPAYDFIVRNNLYAVTGLKAAFGKTLTFPSDSIEVKANWFPVDGIPGYTGDPAKASQSYHVNVGPAGRQFALVSMHVISKLVPNWTWATFEHQNNPARCDIIGCADTFGATQALVPPNSAESKGYGACAKSATLQQMFASVKIDPAFANYCLKGTQVDFTDPTGLAVRLGNSVTEAGFVNRASCMTCHGRAGFFSNGQMSSNFGFDEAFNAPMGPLDVTWFWRPANAGPPAVSPVVPVGSSPAPTVAIMASGPKRIATSADFVWSIPMCAIDDTVKPVKPSRCASK